LKIHRVVSRNRRQSRSRADSAEQADRKINRRDAAALSELLWVKRDRLLQGKPVRDLRQVDIARSTDQENPRPVADVCDLLRSQWPQETPMTEEQQVEPQRCVEELVSKWVARLMSRLNQCPDARQ
jgi:hypothetical protein